MEVGIELHVAEELQLNAHRPKSVDKSGTRRSFWVEELSHSKLKCREAKK